MNRLTPYLFSVLIGIVCSTASAAEQNTAQEQARLLQLVRERGHVIAVGIYKREIIPETSNPKRAQEIFHAFVVHSIKGGIPEGQPIIWARPMERPPEGAIYTHAIFAGQPQLHYLIGHLSKELKNGVKFFWEPVVITPMQQHLHTAFIGLRQHRTIEWEQALQPPASQPLPMDETFWKDFEKRIEQAATNGTDRTTFTF